MPTYDYKCSLCGHTFEDMRTIKNRDEPCEENCPVCKSMRCIKRDFVGAPIYGQGIDFKAGDELNYVMKRISKKYPDNTLRIRD